MRWYRFLALSIIVALLLSACASSAAQPGTVAPLTSSPGTMSAASGPTESAPASQQPATIVTIGFGAQQVERQVYEPLISAFNAQNPGIHVQFVSLDEVLNASDAGSAGPTELLRRVASAADTGVFFVDSAGIKNGYVHDLKPFMDADATFDRADFYPGALEFFRQADGIYAMPHTLPLGLLFYNKDLLAKRGLPAPKPDPSWSDLAAFASQIAQKRGTDVDTYGLLDRQGGMLAFSAELAAAGINIFTTPAEQLQLDRPEVADALKRTVELIKSGAIDVQAQPTSANPGAAQQLILEQRVGLWPLDALLDGPKDPTPSFEIGTVAFPDLSLPAFDGTHAYLMSAGTEHPLEAWRWLSFLSHQPITLPYERPDRLDRVPPRKSVAEKIGYWAKLDPDTRAAVTAALAHPALPPDAIDIPAARQLEGALDSVVRGTQSVEQALHDAQAGLARQIALGGPTPTPDNAPLVVSPLAPDVAPAGATTITFTSLGLGADQTRRLAQEFNRSNAGVFVTVRNIDMTKRMPQLSDVTNSSDCFDWFGPPAAGNVAGLLDLQPLADADATFKLDDFPPVLLAPFKRSGALYGLPYKVDFRLLAYNQTVFDRAGLPHPTANWTPDDFLNTAQQLTSGSARTKMYGFVAPDDQTQPLLFFLRRFGASLTRKSGDTQQPNFTDPTVMQAIRFYFDLLRTSSPHTRLNGYSSDQHDDSFLLTEQGQAGMWFTFGLDPDIYQAQDFTAAIAPPPLGTGPVSPDDFHVSGLYISARSQHPDACWTWLKYLSSAASGFVVGFPARSSVAESQVFANQAPPGAIDVYKAYRAAFDQTLGGVDASLDQSQADLYWFFRAVDRALQGNDLERELDDAQAVTEQYLACVRSGTAAGACARQVDPSYQGTSSATPTPP